MSTMPVLFIGHGSPMNILANNSYTDALKELAASLPVPKAILVVSAHWVTPGLKVTASPNPKQIYDFYGFPDELYKVEYAPPGDPSLASRAAGLLSAAGFPCKEDPTRGIDHAAWAVLVHMYPGAGIPVLELSLDYQAHPGSLFDLGASLAALREEGVLLMGSGNIVHNLYKIEYATDAKPYSWALKFNELAKATVAAGDRDRLAAFALPTEESREAVPTPEHYLPFLAALGAMAEDEKAAVFHESFQNASIAMTGFISSR
ncbi:MAG: 4,5-DOPA dioxygenase extradiol [Rectinemataceae bacterium]|nr:4,5-DOPA dioxygenase extradiol [Rectinemataceae bacterium]